ncbi:hypothetical protein D3C79_892620 [compost metagenome]
MPHRLDSRLCQQGAAKVGVQHGAAQIEDRRQRRSLPLRQSGAERLRPVAAPIGQPLLLLYRLTRLQLQFAQQVANQRLTMLGHQRFDSGIAQQAVNGG